MNIRSTLDFVCYVGHFVSSGWGLLRRLFAPGSTAFSKTGLMKQNMEKQKEKGKD